MGSNQFSEDLVRELAERVRTAGGRALIVGGAVRDHLLGLPVADVDLEIYGLSPAVVKTLARACGEVSEVGKNFGVLEIRRPDGTLHLSLPRRESKVAPGHRGFAVDTDPAMSPEAAARRRDFTINAIAENPLTGEVIDSVGGREDLARKILRVVDRERFGEDPLRVFRAAVFAAQFDLVVDPESARVIRDTVASLRELPRERIGGEWRKLLLRPRTPSTGLKLLLDWGALAALHPEFVLLSKTPQNPQWHPEGDVWTHTLLAVDAAADIARRHALADEERWRVLLATLCHDLGKGETTVERNSVWVSPGHDQAGVAPTRLFLTTLSVSQETLKVVVPLVREHLAPLHFFNAEARGRPVRDGAIRQLARRLHPATVFLLTLVADADHRGRGQATSRTSEVRVETEASAVLRAATEAGRQLRERAGKLGVLHGPPPPVLTGGDLVRLGFRPGPAFRTILERAEALHDQEDLSRDDLCARLRGAASADEALARLQGLS